MKTGFIGSMVAYNLLLHDLTEDIPFRNNDQRLITPKEVHIAQERLAEKLASFETLSPYNDLENKLIGELKRKDYDISRWIDEGELQIERIGDTNFIKVEFLSENPFLSAFVVNTMSTEYIRFNHSLSRSSNDSLQYFSDLVERRKKELDAKTEQLNQARSGGRNIEQEKPIRSVQLAGYEARLREESGRVNKLRESLRKIKSKISDYRNLMGNVDNTDPRNTRKVAGLQARIDELNRIYTEKWCEGRKFEGHHQRPKESITKRIVKANS